MPPKSTPAPENGWRWAAVGTALGALYSLADAYLDGEMGVAPSVSLRLVELAHTLMDHVLPILTGALLGVFVHYLKLRQSIAEMEHRRANELSSDLHKLERDQAVWVISASLLHELKTPLHALGLLLDEMAELGVEHPEEYLRLLALARTQSDRLVREVETLRTVPSSRQPELPELDVFQLVRQFADEHAASMTSKGIDFELEGQSCFAHVEPDYLRIALANLIRNAMSALEAAEAKTILVQVRSSTESVQIVVTDSGPGLSEDAELHLFSPLHTSKADGLGLGLSITRGLLRAMGGDLKWEPSERGAQFVIQLAP